MARHGGTKANESDVNAGPLDTPLSKNGRKQIGFLARSIEDIKIRAVYCSPVFRAVETAKILAKPHHLKAKTVEDLTEARLKPQFVGKKGRKHILTDPEAFEETYEELQKRLVGAVEKIRKAEKGNVIVVSHGDPIEAFLNHFVQRTAGGKGFVLHPDTGSLSIIEYGTPKLVLFNYHRKLFANY